MGFVTVLPEGVMAAAAATAGLAAETAGHGAQATAAGAVVPPGLEEISAANAARITEHATQVSAMLGMAGVIKGLYGTSAGLSSATYLGSDLANAASVGGVI